MRPFAAHGNMTETFRQLSNHAWALEAARQPTRGGVIWSDRAVWAALQG